MIVDNQPPRKVGGDIDYGQLDRPTINRNRRTASMHSGSEATASQLDSQLDAQTDYLDVPTSLAQASGLKALANLCHRASDYILGGRGACLLEYTASI